jgi:hypothetical protein
MALASIKSFFGGTKRNSVPAAQLFEQTQEAEDLRLLTFASLSHAGMPVGLTGAVAYDRVQEILAFGTLHGLIKL